MHKWDYIGCEALVVMLQKSRKRKVEDLRLVKEIRQVHSFTYQ